MVAGHFSKNSDDRDIDITIDSSSLQPFTEQEWRFNQQFMINTQRKRAVTIHVSDQQGNRLQGAVITINQVSKDFPFGSAIAHTILGNLPYQNWFVE
ncbi:endo-1,4-beta-xylanase 5 [Gossypium hirsutum]|uniref:Endo-1,4-beta-xylanase 5 n=1 Tax=Gossypium hirsutum TaxID=3635 RepID=A0ABM3AYQ6_GOSHI|nr:endo-1,4-beta-xylanase 5-like [Gossypium hirsutum]XP_040959928.1 endo-1,4-beta-xylanase 5-like [Gossypium hirsutum]